ncbi:MAG: hypothetical protein LW854_19800 [Rubrivivax sp.]|jgi:hypothetical protein|nr:hypothetical protein [Rubrivivax sp.]
MAVTYKTIDGPKWQWVETYVFAKATYIIACQPDRRCQVGMGVSLLGQPRGEKLRFSEEREITVLGAGALHFRVDDGRGPCRVGFVLKDRFLVTTKWEF